MTHKFVLLAAMLSVTACMGGGDGSNPVNNPGGGTEEPDDPLGGITTVDTIPPGTPKPSPATAIIRSEPQGGDGTGFATGFSYDGAKDEFTVDNLAFDGENTYTRDPLVGTLSTGATVYALYEADITVDDPLNGAPVDQFNYRALYGQSKNKLADGRPTTEFAIVRTGSYIPYGFGGFIYQRNGNVVLPDTGFAKFTGDYAGLRDFAGRGGLEYATGDMEILIDFEDFNTGSGVAGTVKNRAIFAQDGTDLTADYITALNAEYGGVYAGLPVLRFVISDGVANANGEIIGNVTSSIQPASGALEQYEAGTYYAVVSGDPANEIVGVLTVESDLPNVDGVTARETGGFILHRPIP